VRNAASARVIAMEWSDVRIFLAVARSGSLGGAARELGISHPTIGRRLRALEQATGQTLFQRTRDGMTLTEAGQAVLQHAEDMEASALAVERRLAGNDGEPEGGLRISAADWFATCVLAPVLRELARRHPRIMPELVADTRPFDLARREADIAFRIVPFAGADIVQRRLMDVRYALYAAEGAPEPVAGDGSGCDLVLMDESRYTYPDGVWLRDMLPRARVVFSSNSRALQARLCALGLGFAVLPRAVGEQTPGLRAIDLGEAPPSRVMWMGYHRDLRRMDRLRALADLAGDMLGNDEAPDAEQI
jgi:molybdate transport repressor ModE-like protein